MRHLIVGRFKLATKPFPMEADNLVFLQGHAVRNSEFDSTKFDFKLSDDERKKTPKAILRDAIQPLIDIMSGADEDAAWNKLLTDYDHYSVIAYLRQQGMSEGALSMIGPLFNLEARYHL